jgi:hypothetical protein
LAGTGYFDPDSIAYPLRNAGLVHKTTDGFIVATDAAFRIVRIVGHLD